MSDYFNYRRRIEIIIFAFLVLFAFAAQDDQWIGWATMTTMFAILIMIDFMFLDDSSFVFDPDIKNHSRKQKPSY